ncbi:MAG TPA: AAA family ATPase, partial [Ignavibacteriaceae bacterium]|nr:AAA family ATPase [Ignavibacteriaceae bacterium]
MVLLERENYLVELENKFNNLAEESGHVILISGEAGIGKTSVVESFTAKVKDKANVLWGACDALFVPRPLGPLYDMAGQMNSSMIKLLNEQSSLSEIFNGFFTYLKNNPVPNVVIMEDVHWADEATLDFIKFLSRRAGRINSLFIITYRDDEINSKHPLRLVLGDIPTRDLFRIKLPPLTERTVNDIAISSGIKNLYKITGGNPFLVSELLRSKDNGIPSTIKDSILTRISRLSESARDLIEMISIIPTKAEQWLVNELMPDNYFIQDECFQSGILRTEDTEISFRHELTRQAVEESLSEIKRLRYNEKVLQILLNQQETDNYLARIIHHATIAKDKQIIIKYAPIAAKQASKLGAHSLAADHYLNALRYVNEVPPEIQIDLYEGRSYECFLTGQVEEGINAGQTVIELLKKFPDPEREGENYRRISRMLWYDCKDQQAEFYLDKAINIFEKLIPGKKLAMAYSNKSQTYLIREEIDTAIMWGEKV